MKKHLLLTLSLLLITAASALAGVGRSAATEYVDKPVGTAVRTPLMRHAAKTTQFGAVRLRHNAAPRVPLARAVAKGRFAGLSVYPSVAWSEFSGTGMPVLQWNAPARASIGFAADGKVYGFYSVVSQDYALLSHGLNIFDQESGALLESIEYNLFDDKDKVVYGAAYNENEGVAYLLTDNGSGSYLMQKFNPATKAFSLIAKLPSSTSYPMAMAWHARNNGIYMISEGAYLERFNMNKGSFTKVGDSGLLIDDEYGFAGAMVFSPKDENFVLLIETGDADTSFYVVDAITGEATLASSLNTDSQWRILTCLDSNADLAAPDVPTAVTASFAGASLSGSVEVTLPSATVGGSAISGDVYAVVSENGTVLSNTVKGAAGTKVSVPLTLTSGKHTLSVAAMQKADGKELIGPSVRLTVTVGSDVPGAPQNVVLTENEVTWTAPSAANGGFLDVSTLKYNVYINGEAVAGNPFTGTKASVTIPNSGNVAKVASVEAVAGDYVSPRGNSEAWVGRQPFGLPCEIAPLSGDANLSEGVINLFSILDVNRDGRTWLYDVQKEQTGGFYYLCHSENAANDWLVLPQMRFDAPGYYRLSMEVWCGGSYFSGDEKFEVGIGSEASETGLKVISDVVTVNSKNNFEPYEVTFNVEAAGNYYIGIHCVSGVNKYRLYARNFLVEREKGTSAAPAAVADLAAVAAANGVLKADVSFTMPTADVEGNSLDASATLTAIVSCGEAFTSVSGTPGQKMTAQVDATQGDNTIAVRVAAADGSTSPVSSVQLYVGVDVPAYVDLNKVIAADNMGVTLVWTLPTAGLNGGYVDPANCNYEIYRSSESGNYVKIADAGTGATEWKFNVAAGTAQDIYQFGVRPVNAAGAPNSFAVCDVMLGVLNNLPMKESFRSSGENVINNYDPIGIQNVAEQYCSWGFGDPADYDAGEANATSTALIAYYQGYGQVTFPRFSTVGVENVKVSVSMLHGSLAPTEVVLATVTPENNFLPIATVDLSEGSGWKTTSVSLPKECLGQGWAALTVRCFNPTQLHMFMMDGYTIEVNNSTGVALEAVETSGVVRVGGECKVNVSLANYTSADIAVPELTATFKAENGTVTELTKASGSATTILRGEKAIVSYSFKAAPEHLGFGYVNVTITDSDKSDGAGAGEARVNVVKGYTSFISDLTASEEGDKVNLSWSPLALADKVTESFEDFATWERGELLGEFKNLDYDLQTTYGISGSSYPGKYEPTAFEVFAGSEFSVADLQAYSGDQYITVFSPDSRATSPADDWLISPRIAGGTSFSMQILAPTNEFGEESIEVLYSKTGDDTSEFESLGTFSTKDMQWQKVELTLPADAKYFALHYTGFDTFCLMIDDIEFSPYEAAGTVKEYKVYANGAEVGKTTSTSFSVDKPEVSAEYDVVPVVSFPDGSESDWMRSNIAGKGVSSVGSVGAAQSVTAVAGGVEIAGFDGGAFVYAIDGSLVAAPADVKAATFVPLANGVYIVAAGDKAYKVIVR